MTINVPTEYDEKIEKVKGQLLTLIEENAKQGLINEGFDTQYQKIAEEIRTLKIKKLKQVRNQKSAGDYGQSMEEMDSCPNRVSCRVGAFDEDLIRRLIGRIKVVNESKIEIHFKSGIIMGQL